VNVALNESTYSQPDATPPNFPGAAFAYEKAGYTSKAYTAAVGFDYTISPTLINQFKGGFLYNGSVYANNSVNYPETYKFQTEWNGPDGLGGYAYMPVTGTVFPNRVNNFYPLFNFADNLVWQRGSHNLGFGASFYREQDHYWNPPGGYEVANSLLAAGDPALDILQSSNPALASANAQQISEMQGFYPILAGDLQSVYGGSGGHPLNPATHTYSQYGSYNLDELQKAWGFYFKDSWRVRPNLSVNYGLRWDFTGDDHDLQNSYYSPPLAGMFGVSGYNNLFNPCPTPTCANYNPNDLNYIGRSHAYAPWNVSPQPNIGVAWSPQFTEGILGRLTGGGKTVLRAGYSLRRYTVSYQNFWAYASDWGAFFFQGYIQQGVPAGETGQGTYQAGSLTLNNFLCSSGIQMGVNCSGSTFSANNYSLSPPTYETQISEESQAFGTGYALGAVNPHIAQPYIQSWNLGLQRQLGTSSAIEVRYVGNRGIHEWVGLNLNETNIFQNGFLAEFQQAQKNLALNNASSNPNFQGSFGNNGISGQQTLPIFQAAFAGEAAGPDGNFVDYSNGAFTGSTGNLALGQVGSMANMLASPYGYNGNYICNLVPATSLTGRTCTQILGYTGAGGNYAENLFQANPLYPGGTGYMNSVGYSNYNGLQLEFRQKPWNGMQFNANYTWSKNLGVSGQNTLQAFAGGLRSAYAPTNTDRRNVANFYGTYDLPFGKGKPFLGNHEMLGRVVGGWTVGAIVTYMSGYPFQLTGGNSTFNNIYDGGIVLNGVTASQIQHSVGVYNVPCADAPGECSGSQQYVPGEKSWINPKYISSTGLPSSQIQPNTVAGTYGYHPWFYGMHHFAENLSVTKAIAIREGLKFSLQGEAINLFNHPEWDVPCSICTGPGYSGNLQSTNFGVTSNPSGSRVIQVRGDFEF
jgi:hypothetical protein